ncbi:Y-family DNA polymerase [Qipengyuania qiaonensis]|nr:DNA polymerase Y family protein [Qipengyuania qiaonensis]
MRLVALNRKAIACGLAAGTSLADALAIVPGLAVHDCDPVADADLLGRIADGCMRFTPMIALDGADGIMLDITGGAHIFGGERELACEVQDWLDSGQVEARLARGSSAEAAHALARFHQGDVVEERAAIRALPVAALELDSESDLGLRRAGFRTIGDVLDRPRNVIAARFGAAIIYHLERLVGALSKPVNPRRHRPSRTFRRLFAEPIANKDYAMGVLRELLDKAHASLFEEDLGARAFEARFCRVDGLTQRLYVETSLPTRDSAAIARLFDERLDGLADPLDPGFGFDSIELAISRTELLKPEQDDLEKETGQGNSLAETLDILGIRLGRNRLLRFRPHDTHIPEDAQTALFAVDTTRSFSWARAKAGEPPSRPLQLFDPPRPIAVIAEVPDGPPRRFRWQGKLRDAARYEGPERIAAEWWKSAGDPLGRDQLTRDYYRIEDTDGRRYWVFRHGLHGRETDNPNWYMHGLFA